MTLAEPKTGFGQIPRRTFREQIVEVLRTSIISGKLAPGSQIVEAEMARTFGVSRGPLREALGDLIKEGLLVTVPYTGTHVVDLSLNEVNEIFSLRTELEIFAFRQIWDKRDQAYYDELNARHDRLLASIASGDDESSIVDELALHSHVYEASGHSLLLGVWNGLRGKLQLYWAAHHRAHGRRGPLPTGHTKYVEFAQGEDIDLMIEEIRDHMVRGFAKTEAFLREREQFKRGEHS
ncbi:GntR family transcriptional regulator [Nitratireductor sp. ZSWI3]|uniref:GntR family transcriptional regulator n=1 Tax=Nitratireductor sp. ZSWI3 TaxID=2966359 RepID=UPI00215069D1|nr:GntR family transcriptional regulator [Nitratireductor sp. ZSWI3]MCR4267568.1 GntR family transcriptional regulator [Nitratireductor sp. ZSWI3]